MLYVTPDKFRTGGWGVNLAGIDDIELRSILHRAGSMANEYCTVPNLPSAHDFRGGVTVDELGTWDIGSGMLAPQRRYYPYHRPLRSVEGFQIVVTNSQGITFNPSELYVGDDFIEVVSMAMTSYGLFGAAIIPNIGLTRPQVRISYTYGRSIPVLNEELEISDAKTFRAQNQWWDTDDDVEPVVRVNGVETTAGLTIDYDEGTVTLDSVTATTRVHVDYSHRLPSAVAEASGIIAAELLGERNLTRKGLAGLIELAVGEVRIRRDFPRAGVKVAGIGDRARQLLDPYRFITARGGA